MESLIFTPDSTRICTAVYSFWKVCRTGEFAINETIIPKGAVEIIFNLGSNPIHAEVNQHPVTVPKCFIQAYSTSPIYLCLSANQTFFGVTLKPLVVKHIFNFPPSICANHVFDLTVCDHSIYSLWHQLGELNNFHEQIASFTEWLCKRLPQPSPLEIAFNDFLNNDNYTGLSVKQLADQLCYSTRQLSRKLIELTGMNAENILLYKKYLQAMHLIHTSELSLTEIAYNSNFFDQSHFIKTFKGYSCLTPHEYRKRKSETIGHIVVSA